METKTTHKISLSKTAEDYQPKTFEEWCDIHGEPEYGNENNRQTITKKLDIQIEEYEQTTIEIDKNEIVTFDKKGNSQLNYVKCMDAFIALNNCVFCNGLFYTPDGQIGEQTVRTDIQNSLVELGLTGKLDNIVKSLYRMVADRCAVEQLPINSKIIPLANGDLHINKDKWVFHWGEKKHAPYRLSVDYTPVDKPMPLFEKYLREAFMLEDIDTIQEIMGYCLIPSTAVGEAFIIVGDAEAGKSGIGTILAGLLGNALITMDTQDLVTQRFQIASIENKLLAYDDDLGSAALTETGRFKKIITADTPISAERKYEKGFQFVSYCRVLASANFMLSSLYDDSDGFYRRLHPILVKPKDKKKEIIHHFYEQILETEKTQILKWALLGLRRVIENGWKISWSQRSLDYIKNIKSTACHFDDFLKETCEITTDGSDTTSSELITLYRRWCKDNGLKELSDRRLLNWFADNEEKLQIKRSENLHRRNKRVRGYKYLKIKNEWKNVVII